jgi:predicted nicotinamide N-methyase
MDPEELVLQHTVVATPPLCPELRLHLVTETCPLWRATEADLARLGLSEPYWAFCWPGGQALARHLLDHPALVAGARVLDFGAGSGVEAIAALRAGAAHALAADIDPLAGVACRLNARLNDVALEVTDEDLVGSDRGWDVVLVGDMFYERRLAERVWS